ncbi:DnaJ domain-containing protein [Phycicoccus sp. BSK3Z-2]|uniref:DnaJ domain-containing protein n=1 Tax=Phycicoccus avicenniae TaxID=2828860 RepID=A0A941DAT2_9MICO|nr:DnaJ domain-containing protein [Phycicoccus avicenniae]MBR7742992.1 DnaJ domain-containing protein [Phycicoccus avicenniae]
MTGERQDRSHYALLGVPEDASEAEIGKAFMRAMREAHPDQHASGSAAERAEAEEHARRLTEAHGVLTGPDRIEYDELLRAQRSGSASPPPARTPEAPASHPADVTAEASTLPVQDTVLRLTRERWKRGGTLVPNEGGRPITVPAEVEHDAVLVFEGRGLPSQDGGAAGDLHVRVVHVDRRGHELSDGHGVDTGGFSLQRAVRDLGPVQAALVGAGLVVALVALLVLLFLG